MRQTTQEGRLMMYEESERWTRKVDGNHTSNEEEKRHFRQLKNTCDSCLNCRHFPVYTLVNTLSQLVRKSTLRTLHIESF